MAGWNTYLDAITTRVAGVTGINMAYRAGIVDPDKLVRVSRWPKAIITHEGVTLDPYSGGIYDGTFVVTLCINAPRGTEGGYASQQLGTIAEAVVDELTHTRDSSDIRLISDNGEQVESVGGQEIYMQLLRFSYSVPRN